MVRAGDTEAFAVLRERHEVAARRLARHLVASPYEVDDVVGEAFAWVLDVTQRGGGPSNAVRPYVLTVLRRVCYYRLTGQLTWQGTGDRGLPEPGEPFIEPSMAGIETALMAGAYVSLPDRWRAVLWHAQVEQARPAEVAPLLGLTRNGVLALNRRAIDGLRQAYLQRHLATDIPPECRVAGERLDHFVRDPNATADAAMVSAHLDSCDQCRAVYSELSDVAGTLRAVVGPLILGAAAEAYLFGPGESSAAAGASSGRHAAQAAITGAAATAVAGGAATSAMRATRRAWRRPRTSRTLAAAAAVVVIAAIAVPLALTAGPSTPTSSNSPNHPAVVAPPTSPSASSPTVQPTSPAPSPSPSPPSSPPTTTAPPSPATAAAPVTTGLAASLGTTGGRDGNSLQFQVTNTGNIATGPVTVSINLPDGTSVGGGGTRTAATISATDWGNGWTCQPTRSGATCTHDALGAGQQTGDQLPLNLGQGACGQPVSITATSGTLSAEATRDLAC